MDDILEMLESAETVSGLVDSLKDAITKYNKLASVSIGVEKRKWERKSKLATKCLHIILKELIKDATKDVDITIKQK